MLVILNDLRLSMGGTTKLGRGRRPEGALTVKEVNDFIWASPSQTVGSIFVSSSQLDQAFRQDTTHVEDVGLKVRKAVQR